MTEESDFRTEEFCLLGVTIEFVVFKRVQYCGNVLDMGVNGFGPDDDIVKVHMADSPNEGAERGCYSSLMDCWGILDSHRHHDPLIKTPRSVYRSEFYVVRVHACLEKTVSHVDGSEEHAISTIRQDF